MESIEPSKQQARLVSQVLDLGSGLNVETPKYPIKLAIPSHRLLLSIQPPAREATMGFLGHTPMKASTLCRDELDDGICWLGVAT